jgi:hypothetical protein
MSRPSPTTSSSGFCGATEHPFQPAYREEPNCGRPVPTRRSRAASRVRPVPEVRGRRHLVHPRFSSLRSASRRACCHARLRQARAGRRAQRRPLVVVPAGGRAPRPAPRHPESHRPRTAPRSTPRRSRLRRAHADPAPRRLTLTRVVVIGAPGNRVQVVDLLSLPELSDRDHPQTCRARPAKVRPFRRNCKCVPGLSAGSSTRQPGGRLASRGVVSPERASGCVNADAHRPG